MQVKICVNVDQLIPTYIYIQYTLSLKMPLHINVIVRSDKIDRKYFNAEWPSYGRSF